MNVKEEYRGVIVPMVSPFTKNLLIDKPAAAGIAQTFSESGVTPFVLGTTGEAPSIPVKQKRQLVKTTVLAVNGKTKVFAGISSNSFSESVEEARIYSSYGVNALVATLPAYYPLTPGQMSDYFSRLADVIPCPLFLYNIPATTHLSIPLDVVEKLSHHQNIAGIKDSEGNLQRLDESLERWEGRDDFVFLVGWAAMSVYGLQRGANGIVPSGGNLCPGLYKQLFDHVKKGETEQAIQLQEKSDRISLFYQNGRNLGQSIAALKVLMAVKNRCRVYVLPPLSTMESGEEKNYRIEMGKRLEELNF